MSFADHNLIDVRKAFPDMVFDIRYATEDNFTGKPVYVSDNCYLHREAAEKLSVAVISAKKLGFGIKLFDAFRPHEAQEILWAHTPDENFLANPARGSAHSRGVAVDLTLIDSSGNEIEMGTEFDAFTPLSYHTEIAGISPEALKNRAILLGIMSAAGFDFYKNEWWHYQLFNAKNYPLIKDIDAKTGLIYKV